MQTGVDTGYTTHSEPRVESLLAGRGVKSAGRSKPADCASVKRGNKCWEEKNI